MLKALALPPRQRPIPLKPVSWWERAKRRLRIKARKYMRPRVVTLSGVRLEVDPKLLPAPVVRSLYKESYEDREAALVRDVLEPGDRVLEVGAGIGFISLLCAQRCGPEAVLCYEANPENGALIRRNFELNGMSPQFRNRAVSATGDDRELFVAPNIVSTSFIDRGDGARKVVECDAIGDVIKEFRPNCLVMDVEGAEIDLLPAAPLEHISKMIVETHAHIVGAAAVRDLDVLVQSQGFARFEAFRNSRVWLYLRQ